MQQFRFSLLSFGTQSLFGRGCLPYLPLIQRLALVVGDNNTLNFNKGKAELVEPTTTITYIQPLKLKTSSSLFAGLSAVLPRIHDSAFQELATKKFAVIPNFSSPPEHCELLTEDIKKLRQQSKFKVARLGQDSTNQLNEETCFLGVDKLKVVEFLRHPEIFFTTH